MKLFKPDVHKEMDERLWQAESDDLKIRDISCPSCHQKKLCSVSVERGKSGWETKFFCDSCKTKGILNHTGFHVELSYLENRK